MPQHQHPFFSPFLFYFLHIGLFQQRGAAPRAFPVLANTIKLSYHVHEQHGSILSILVLTLPATEYGNGGKSVQGGASPLRSPSQPFSRKSHLEIRQSENKPMGCTEADLAAGKKGKRSCHQLSQTRTYNLSSKA